ncbi:MAG: hypothetical protein QGF03_09070 [SAR324 cluster bacterium]|nr:hypothetical protein [SAR324 cluster bacterium]
MSTTLVEKQRKLFGGESRQQHPAAQVELLRRHRLARQGVGQTSSGGEEPAGRAERLRKELFGGLEAVRTVGLPGCLGEPRLGIPDSGDAAVFDCGV